MKELTTILKWCARTIPSSFRFIIISQIIHLFISLWTPPNKKILKWWIKMFEINHNIHGLKLSWTEKSPRFKIGCLILVLNVPINTDTALKTGSDYIPRINNLVGYFFWKDTFIAYQYIQHGINYLYGKRLLHNLYFMIRTSLWENTFRDYVV